MAWQTPIAVLLAQHFVIIKAGMLGRESEIGHGGNPQYTVHIYSISYC